MIEDNKTPSLPVLCRLAEVRGVRTSVLVGEAPSEDRAVSVNPGGAARPAANRNLGGNRGSGTRRSVCFLVNRVSRRRRLFRGLVLGGSHRSLPGGHVQITTRLVHPAAAERRGLHGDRGVLWGIDVSQRRTQLRHHKPQFIRQLRVSGQQAPQPALPLAHHQSLLDLLIPRLPSG